MKEEDRVVKQCGETQKGALSRTFWLATLQLAEELIQLRDDLENLCKSIVGRESTQQAREAAKKIVPFALVVSCQSTSRFDHRRLTCPSSEHRRAPPQLFGVDPDWTLHTDAWQTTC